jgi:hypothetical protein
MVRWESFRADRARADEAELVDRDADQLHATANRIAWSDVTDAGR